MVCSGGGGSHFTIVGSIKTIQSSDSHATHYCKTKSRPPTPVGTIQIVLSLDKLNANLMIANVETETCS
jgi:hypothetical protein